MDRNEAASVIQRFLTCRDICRDECCGHCETCRYNTEYDEKTEALKLAIAALEGKDIGVSTKWIPATVELPKEKGEYLVTYHPCCWNNVGKEKRVGMDTFKGKTSWAKNKYQRVIAWMKKPEPWEGE